jgi:hypothetical protein
LLTKYSDHIQNIRYNEADCAFALHLLNKEFPCGAVELITESKQLNEKRAINKYQRKLEHLITYKL